MVFLAIIQYLYDTSHARRFAQDGGKLSSSCFIQFYYPEFYLRIHTLNTFFLNIFPNVLYNYYSISGVVVYDNFIIKKGMKYFGEQGIKRVN